MPRISFVTRSVNKFERTQLQRFAARSSCYLRAPFLVNSEAMNWKRTLAYITGSVDQELLLRNEYLATENRIL